MPHIYHIHLFQVSSSAWTRAAWAQSTLRLIPLCRGSTWPVTPAHLVPPASERFTSWLSRVKACATSCGVWTASLRATSSWGRWTLREPVTGHSMWFLKEGWKPDWLARRCYSTQGHSSDEADAAGQQKPAERLTTDGENTSCLFAERHRSDWYSK